jgi:heat shock protein HslJ
VKVCADLKKFALTRKVCADLLEFALQKMALNLRKTAKKVRGNAKKFAIIKCTNGPP